jgi:CHAD domain-containing protein
MPVSTVRVSLLRKRLEMFTRMLHGVEKGDVRALHRTRVASRRLRELLPVLHVDAPLTRKLGRRLHKVTDRLGTVRELDVLLLVLDELHDPGRLSDHALARVRSAVEKERAQAGERLFDKLPVAELHRLSERLNEVADDLGSVDAPEGRRADRATRWAIEAQAARRGERLANAMREAGAVYLPDRLHAVRIAVKKLRYALELRDEVHGVKRSEDVRTLRRAQDLLGRMHDLQVLIERVRQVQAALTPPDSTIWDEFDALVDALENDCRRLHARYMRERDALAAICASLAKRPKSGLRTVAVTTRAS